MRTFAIIVTAVLATWSLIDRKYWAAAALFLCAAFGAWST